MRIAITGSTGLIGSALIPHLLNNGHDVTRLVRGMPRTAGELQWSPGQELDPTTLAGVDAVVHLAGAGVGDRRWTPAYRQEILRSRTEGTHTIAAAVAAAGVPVLISGSAIGFYGDTGETAVDEQGPQGAGFLADVVAAWEAAAQPASDAGARVACIRTGLVASTQGGAFGKTLPLFKLGLGGPLGSGRQYWSSISMQDEVRAIEFLITHPVAGPVNCTAPTPVTNAEFTAALGRALHRPALLPVPAFALRIAVGAFASEILASQRVVPQRLLEAGFTFHHPTVADIVSTLA